MTSFQTREGLAKAVDGVSLYVDKKEMVALVGESGCGKSVTALSIMQLVQSPPGKIVAGEVIWKGQDLLKLDADAVRQLRGSRLAMVFQEPMTSLNPVLTVGRQIVEVLQLHRRLDLPNARLECARVMTNVGMADAERVMKRYPHECSGGMRQRIMIAMALCCHPDLLIADEPTTAIDVTIQAQILELINRLASETQMAVLLITHNLGIVARYSQRIYVMYAGRVIEQGTAEDIYTAPAHPYTIGLLRCVPRLDQACGEQLATIDGEPPDLLRLPGGCAFRPRCVYLGDECHPEAPHLRRVKDNHWVACWRQLPTEE